MAAPPMPLCVGAALFQALVDWLRPPFMSVLATRSEFTLVAGVSIMATAFLAVLVLKAGMVGAEAAFTMLGEAPVAVEAQAMSDWYLVAQNIGSWLPVAEVGAVDAAGVVMAEVKAKMAAIQVVVIALALGARAEALDRF